MRIQSELIIRGGIVVDGTGADPRRADISIKDGVIVAVGTDIPAGAREIDATGLVVTPGFIDIHTHYDGQAIWSTRLNPSSSHGVTTVVIGNCGVGFAPCKPADRELLVMTMEGVEDIPGVVMKEGLTWDWETFPEYLDVLDSCAWDIDVAAYVPHSAVRVFAMGERGANREPATDEDLAVMSEIVREAVQAGAIGFSSSRTPLDRRSDGALVPTFAAGRRELIAVGNAVREAGGGVLQLISELGIVDGVTLEEEVAFLSGVVEAVELPLTYSLAQGGLTANHDADRWRKMLHMSDDANKKLNGRLRPQYFPRPIGIIASFDLTSNPFLQCPSYKKIAHLPIEQRIVELRKPEVRRQIISEEPTEALLPLTALTRNFKVMYALNDPPNYEPAAGTSILSQAEKLGISPEELAYDLLLERDGKAMLYFAVGNYSYESLDFITEFFDNPSAVMGLGDGGAHYGLICDSSYPTFVLSHWTRDRAGQHISLARAVKAMSSEPANFVGLNDRGIIAPGYKADINVIDHANLKLEAPKVCFDLPAGGRRLDQKASGYRWTIVSGEIISCDDCPTGTLPGRLVRGSQQRSIM